MINLILKEQLKDKFNFVRVHFAGSKKPYTYKTTLTLEEGDFVVVNAPSGLTVVTVTEVNVPVTALDFDINWIVDKVNTTIYKRCAAMEVEAKKELKKQAAHSVSKAQREALEQELGTDGIAAVKAVVRL